MTLTPTVAIDCCLKDDGLRLFLGLSSNNTLRLSLCVYFLCYYYNSNNNNNNNNNNNYYYYYYSIAASQSYLR